MRPPHPPARGLSSHLVLRLLISHVSDLPSTLVAYLWEYISYPYMKVSTYNHLQLTSTYRREYCVSRMQDGTALCLCLQTSPFLLPYKTKTTKPQISKVLVLSVKRKIHLARSPPHRSQISTTGLLHLSLPASYQNPRKHVLVR
jgi:hypothetical protein